MNENNKHHGRVMHILVKAFYFYSEFTQQSRNGDSGKQEGGGVEGEKQAFIAGWQGEVGESKKRSVNE